MPQRTVCVMKKVSVGVEFIEHRVWVDWLWPTSLSDIDGNDDVNVFFSSRWTRTFYPFKVFLLFNSYLKIHKRIPSVG